jgi:hypothetical protein
VWHGIQRARAAGLSTRDTAALCDAVMRQFMLGKVEMTPGADGTGLSRVVADGMEIP